jgi:hypothetical protein
MQDGFAHDGIGSVNDLHEEYDVEHSSRGGGAVREEVLGKWRAGSSREPCSPAPVRERIRKWDPIKGRLGFSVPALTGLAAGLALLLAPGESSADWSAQGNPLSTRSSHQSSPWLASDGRNGVIAVWDEYGDRFEDYDVYAQRFTPFGDVASGWPINGALICGAIDLQDYATGVTDPEGNAIVAWMDRRNRRPDIYAQRLGRNGAIAAGWAKDGIPVCAKGTCEIPNITTDGAGGAFVSWFDTIRLPVWALRIQHFSADGLVVSGWPDTGIVVATAEGLDFRACQDGSGGVLLTWTPFTTPFTSSDLLCQRISGSGALSPGWPVAGVLISGTLGGQNAGAILPTGDGGALVAWDDTRADVGDIYVARLTGAGAVAAGWPTEGVPVCTAIGEQTNPRACSDGAGGILLVWEDARSGNWDIFASRATATGARGPGWPAEGTVVCGARGATNSPPSSLQMAPAGL